MSFVHMMGEYTCAYIRREEELICGECNEKYESNYEFMVAGVGTVLEYAKFVPPCSCNVSVDVKEIIRIAANEKLREI